MPITQSAKKALRQSIKNKQAQDKRKANIKSALKIYRQNPTKATLSTLYSTLDRGVKKNVIHKNKSSRLKSRLAKLLKTKKPNKKNKRQSPKKSS